MKKPPRGTLHIIAQSHIDLAWLWQFDPETIHGCCQPTFSLATENLDKYPEYRFSQSQVPLYTATAKAFPDLFAKMTTAITRGAWEIVGGMFVEFDGGEPGGEALVRQCVAGKRYFQATFGVDVTTGWQEDAWTHPWQLPQILRKCGMDSYMFKRGAKGDNLCWWQSPDGSRVLAYKPYHKGHKGPSKEWLRFFEEMQEKYHIDDVMIRIGKGDHGGGPFAKDIEAIKRFAQQVAPNLDVKFNTFAGYVKVLMDKTQASDRKHANPQKSPTIPVLNSELGHELAGDLTNCCGIKQSNRFCEVLLLRAEFLATLANLVLQRQYPYAELEQAWEMVLFNQFHDIIGGSGIPPVCKDAQRDYTQVMATGGQVLSGAANALAGAIITQHGNIGEKSLPGKPIIVFFNSLSWDRTYPARIFLDQVQLRDATGFGLYDDQDNPVPIQITSSRKQDSQAGEIIATIRCPSMGYASYYLGPRVECKVPIPTRAEGTRMENAFFRIDLDPLTGEIAKLFDKRTGKEILSKSLHGNRLVALRDKGDSEGRFKKHKDADNRPPTKEHKISTDPQIRVTESGPLRAKIEVIRKFQHSLFIQEIILHAEIPRIDFYLEIHWFDVHYMIKIAFPFVLQDGMGDIEVTSDSAYGAIRRPADGTEYPCQKWVDLYSPKANYGVAVLNDARYGYDVLGSSFRLSILRSPTTPALNTDNGIHAMRYSLYPHVGTWQAAKVMQQGYELNYDISSHDETIHGGSLSQSLSFLRVKPANVIVEVVKLAYDSKCLIIRAWETEGTACDAELTLSWPLAAAEETDLLERSTKPQKVFDIHVNQIYAHFGACEIKTLKVSFEDIPSNHQNYGKIM